MYHCKRYRGNFVKSKPICLGITSVKFHRRWCVFYTRACYAPDLRREAHYKMMAGVCLSSVHPSVCRVPRPNSRTERPKIGRIETNHIGNL